MKPFGMLRFVLAVGLIALTAILLQARGRTEIIPPRTPLSSFPCSWGIGPVKTSRSIKILWTCWGPASFWCADIATRMANYPTLIFFLPIFPASVPEIPSTPQSIVCRVPDGLRKKMTASPFRCPAIRLFPANRYVISKAGARKLVLYWYWAHDRGVASEYWAKYYLVKDAIRMNRSDGALVRITTGYVSWRVDQTPPNSAFVPLRQM